MQTVTVVGLGKLGLCLAAILAEYYKVVGIDCSEEHIHNLSTGKNTIKEPDLDYYLAKGFKNMTFTTSYEQAEGVVFVVVPTPSNTDDRFSSEYVEQVLYYMFPSTTVAIVSTLMPGETDRLQAKYPNLNLVYNPTFIALGSVIKNFLKPDFILLGSHNPEKTSQLAAIYNNVCYYPKYQVMTPLEAEIAKLTLNCYITTKITFANQIGNLCWRLGIEPTKILDAVGMDKRVGKKCFKAGLGYGGPCFPRDNLAMSAYMRSNYLSPQLTSTVHNLNERQVDEMLDRIKQLDPDSISFKSLSYKKGTNNEEQSQLKLIHDILQEWRFNVVKKNGEVKLDWNGITKGGKCGG